MASALLAALALSSHAQDPQPGPANFHHTAWAAEHGLGAVLDVQQDSDGALWLTTSRGVLRFDGVRFQSVEEVTDGSAPNDDIFSVFVSAHGGIWLTTRTSGLLLWKDGRMNAFRDRRCTPTAPSGGVAEESDGSLWIQGATGLFHLHGAVCDEVGPERGYPGGLPAALLVDRAGNVWTQTRSGALLFRPRGQQRFRQVRPGGDTRVPMSFLHQDPHGFIWLSGGDGLRRIAGEDGTLLPQAQRRLIGPQPFHDFTFAPDGALWAVAPQGVERFERVVQSGAGWIGPNSPGRSFTPLQGLTSNAASKVFLDREQSVWVATSSGLDQLRRTVLNPLELNLLDRPAAEEHEFGVAAAGDGSLWVGNASMPLTHVLPDGRLQSFPKVGPTIMIRRDREGYLWSMNAVDATLWRSTPTGFQQAPYPDQKTSMVAALAVDRNGDPWISLPGNGTYQRVNGAWVNRNDALGKQPRVLGAMTTDEQGNVWFAFSNKLVRWDGAQFQRFAFPDGPLNVSVRTMAVRGEDVWLAGQGGIVLFRRGVFHLLNWKTPGAPGRVSGLVETAAGDLWANSFSGITHVSAEELRRWLADPASPLASEEMDPLDGLPGLSGTRLPEPSLVESPGGRLWFATTRGVAWLDPAALAGSRNRIAPTVRIESIRAEGKTYKGPGQASLPVHTQELEIDYTAFSLAIPERVLFRYRLEGVDDRWQEAGTRRQAFYNSLAPGSYRFHVIACNNDGVWNDSGASLLFSIAPAFYQRAWFTALVVCALCGLLWFLVRLRIRSVTRRLQGRLADRLSERESIARELHDTILQGFYAVLLRLQMATDELPRAIPARRTMEDALLFADRVLEEARDRVSGLRGQAPVSADLGMELARAADECRVTSGCHFQLTVEGHASPLHPLVQEEVGRVGQEAIINAFRHAGATAIVAVLTYEPGLLHLKITDNGRGFARDVLQAGGREGHWGMPGMRERCRRIGAEIRIANRFDGGAVVSIRIAAALAYRNAKAHGATARGDVLDASGAMAQLD